jgi:hypothetical protein
MYALLAVCTSLVLHIMVHIGPKDSRSRPAVQGEFECVLHAPLCIEFLARLHLQPFTGEGVEKKQHVGVEIQP